MPRSADEVLEHEFLQIRAKLLEIAAFYDRLDEAGLDQPDESAAEISEKLELLKVGCQQLVDNEPGKAARIQLLFSREYDENWRQKFSL
ncbi:MAG: hypothetical protein AB8B50_02720 [Pirellulaceae bacterium]